MLLLFFPFHCYKLFFFYFQWLVKRAIETREEMGDYIRSYSISQFQKTHRLPEVRSSQFLFLLWQKLRCSISFTALKSAQYTGVAFASVLFIWGEKLNVMTESLDVLVNFCLIVALVFCNIWYFSVSPSCQVICLWSSVECIWANNVTGATLPEMCSETPTVL